MNESIKTKNLFADQFGPNRANHFERILLTMFIVGDQQMRRRENNFSSTVSIFINSYFVDLSRIVSSLEFICYKHSLKTYIPSFYYSQCVCICTQECTVLSRPFY